MRSNSWQFSFNLWYLYELKHKVCLSKSMSGIFHFWFHFVFIKIYVFVQQKGWTLLVQNVIIPFKTRILEKPHMLLVPYPCFFFKLQKEVKIQWCLRELELLKNWPADKFSELIKWKSGECQFFSIVHFKQICDISLLNNLLIFLTDLKNIY